MCRSNYALRCRTATHHSAKIHVERVSQQKDPVRFSDAVAVIAFIY